MFSILLAETNRAKAYIQNLCATGLAPAAAVLLAPAAPAGPAAIASTALAPDIITSVDAGVAFNAAEPVSVTLKKYGIPHISLACTHPNESEVVAAVRTLPGEYCVYAGPGGVILGPELLAQGTTFLHAHPGRLPDYRGSTTFYYSLLAEGRIFCSVIAMARSIDAGPVLHEASYTLTDPEIDIDKALDPLIRTATLVAFLRDFDPASGEGRAQPKNGTDFYIIHPVLKHAAILRARAACRPGPTEAALAAMRPGTTVDDMETQHG